MEQRNGRIDRFGQKHPPQIFNLVYETEATPDQRILSKITDRLDEARREFGSVSALIEDIDASAASELEASFGILLNETKLTEQRLTHFFWAFALNKTYNFNGTH